MMSPVPCTLTASWVSVTKAGGLSDAPGAERSLNGEDGDTVTHMMRTYHCVSVTSQYPMKSSWNQEMIIGKQYNHSFMFDSCIAHFVH